MTATQRLLTAFWMLLTARRYHCPPHCIVLYWAGGNAGCWHGTFEKLQCTASKTQQIQWIPPEPAKNWIIVLKSPYRKLKRTWLAASLCFTVMAYSLFVGLVGPLGMDHSSFHWRAPRDLERVEPWDPMTNHLTEPCQEASTSSLKAAGPARPILPAAAPAASVSTLGGWWGHVEGEYARLQSSSGYSQWTQEHSSTPSKPPARSPKKLSSVSDGVNLLPRHLSFPHPSPRYACMGSSSPCRESSSICTALKQLCSFRDILLILVNKRIRNPLGKA